MSSDELTPPATPAAIRSFTPPAVKILQAVGPILLDLAALAAALIAAIYKVIEPDVFKGVLYTLVGGNIALRLPGRFGGPPSGGGMVMAIGSGLAAVARATGGRVGILVGIALLCVGCGAAEVAKQDAKLAADFTACELDAKRIARAATSCSESIASLLSLMASQECIGFPSSRVDAGTGINIGGVTYICHAEVPNGR